MEKTIQVVHGRDDGAARRLISAASAAAARVFKGSTVTGPNSRMPVGEKVLAVIKREE